MAYLSPSLKDLSGTAGGGLQPELHQGGCGAKEKAVCPVEFISCHPVFTGDTPCDTINECMRNADRMHRLCGDAIEL